MYIVDESNVGHAHRGLWTTHLHLVGMHNSTAWNDFTINVLGPMIINEQVRVTVDNLESWKAFVDTFPQLSADSRQLLYKRVTTLTPSVRS